MTEPLEIDPCTIALHPIHDADHRHVADRVAYRQQQDSEGDDTMAATARALASAVYELGDAGLLGNRTLFVTLPSQWLDRPELLPTPAPRMAIGIADAERVTDTLLGRLDEVRERGYRVVVPARLLKQDPEALLPRADIITLISPDELGPDLLAPLPQRKIKLLVENIRNPEELARYRHMGCHFYNGDYLARPASSPRARGADTATEPRRSA